MTRVVTVWALLGLSSVAIGCAASTAERASSTTPAPKTAPPKAPAAQVEVAAEPPAASASVALAPSVDGGEIAREELLDVLAQGIGRFLQRVRVSADRDAKGRFAGWRLVRLFPGEASEGQGVLQAGDSLLRVNGQSIERPEQLKTVWDSLATSSELILTVRRAEQQSEVRYRISTLPKLPVAAAPPIPASATARP